MPKTTAQPAETLPDDAATLEGGAGSQAPKAAPPVAEATAPVTEAPAGLIEDAIDAEADLVAPVDMGQADPTPEGAADADAEAGAPADGVPGIHLPSALRVAIVQIDMRNTDWQRGDLLDELTQMGATLTEAEAEGEASFALYGIRVTSHLSTEFLLNYWAAQARQTLLGRAA